MTIDKLKELVENASGDEYSVLYSHFNNKCGWGCGSNQTELHYWKDILITSCKKCLNKRSPFAKKLTAKEVFIVKLLY